MLRVQQSLLVKNNSSKGYSAIVEKAIIAIKSDLSADLNLSILAQRLSVSNVYLSSTFKKETGMTITEYIRKRRLNYATYLLKNTSIQVQTVAMHCGIVDVQYFTKLFKKEMGMTPSEYRRILVKP